jgi:predicted DNA-binding protein (MmcQ/YjbR family)
MPARKSPTDAALRELRAFGLGYPGAHTKSPWPGHLDLAVNDKTFAYLSVEGEPFVLSCKLPSSSEDALTLPFVAPAPYGLGKSGWVRAELPAGPVPIELFKAWIDESYRAQAPKRLSKQLGLAKGEVTGDEPAPQKAPARKVAAKKAPAKEPVAKKVAARKPAPQRTTPRATGSRKLSQRKAR